jgi:endonuclease G
MKKLLLITILLYSYVSNCQVDTIIRTDIYTSYYSFRLKNPVMVVYNLHRGGGDCSRADFHFRKDSILGKRMATPQDYAKSGYDEGHLANAEDFAFNCVYDKETFHFWNCSPQTPQLNRGIWKVLEDRVRKISETDSILILCGSIFDTQTIGSGVYVPTQCWKVVYSYTEKKVILSNIFTNTTSPVMSDIDYNILAETLKTKYNIVIMDFLK